MQSIKNIARRFLSLSLCLLMILVTLPSLSFTALADEVSGLSDTGIILDKSGDAVCNASGDTVTVSVTGDASCNRTKSGTLTIKNGKGAEAVLKFDYDVTLNGGLVSVDGTSISADISGSFEKALGAGESLSVSLTSAANGNTTSVKISNISMLADVDANVTFLPAENGSYTVDGTTVTDEITITKNSSETFTLVATPAEGYKFLGWKNVISGGYLSYSAAFATGFDADATIMPVFTLESNPVFTVDGAAFTDLNEAGAYAVENSKTLIVLAQDGTLPAGDYTVPAGTVLLIPFDDNNTLYLNTIEAFHEAHQAQSPYRTLTLADGANITVANGAAISVGSRICAHGTNTTSWNGTPTGKYGHIAMEDGSKITVNDGGFLFAYGYISGEGAVDILSGGNVYELFQIRNWRGGSATTDAGFTENGVFPMSQYYVQNIEVPLTIEAGATETAVAAVNAQNMAVSANAAFIGEGGMFVNSGAITKRYDGATDRTIFDVEGDLSISPLALSAGGMNLNTETFALPINNNITINVNSGSTSLSQDAAFLPGSEINVGADADLTINSGCKVYVYDKDEWGKYGAANAEIVPVGYSTVNGATVVRKAADLTDARMNINGTITVNGELYTTASGADITSSEGTGKIIYNNTPGTETKTYQCLQINTTVTPVEIPVTSAKLHNGNVSIPYTETVETAKDDYYTYSTRKHMWVKGDDVYYHIVWKNDDGTVLKEEDVDAGVVPSYTGETPTKAATAQYTYTFSGWSPSPSADADAEYVAQYNSELRNYTVTWKNEDGTVLKTDESVPYGTIPAYDGETPQKASDAQYHYVFTNWDAELEAVTGDVTYTAVFTPVLRSYTVKWANEDGTVVETDTNVDYGTIPTFDGETPQKADTVTTTYTFAGWTPEVETVTGDVTYTAVYTAMVRSGWVEFNDNLYFVDNGEVVTGIARLPYPDAMYGFEEDPEAINDAGYPNDGKGTFILSEEGALRYDISDIYLVDGAEINAAYPTDFIADGDMVYVRNGEILWHPGEICLDEEVYYFASGNTMIKNRDYTVYRVETLTRGKKYSFDAEGKLIRYDGLVDIGDDTYYYEDYAKTYAGLIQLNGDYYYINSACKAVKNRSYFVSKTNGLLPAGNYDFDAEGKMLTAKNGIVKEADGWFYYKDNKRTYAGLFKMGNDYYYAKTNCEVLHDVEYYISKTNGLLPQGKYTFDSEGKLVMRDGIVKNGNTWTYYVNGAKTYAGLFKIGNDIYYAKSDCTVVHGQDYYVSKTNGILPQGKYTFDADGKLVMLNGIVKDGDDWTYYVNGAKTYAGLIEIDGDYYYVNSAFKVIHSQNYFVSKTNGILKNGSYAFDENGALQY